MSKVIPYEHNVRLINSMSNESIDSLNKLYQKFTCTEDRWIKKLIALRILNSKLLYQIEFDLSKLQESIECRINI